MSKVVGISAGVNGPRSERGGWMMPVTSRRSRRAWEGAVIYSPRYDDKK